MLQLIPFHLGRTEQRKESFEAAKEHAYRSGELEGSADDPYGTLLPDDYPEATKSIAERRAMLTGYRLPGLLQDLFPQIVP